jgi:hypothetical protein
VYEVELLNGVIQGYYETDNKKTDIKYSNDEDAKKKMKNKKYVFEFLYDYNKKTTDPCCVVSFEYDPLLGVAMTVLIYLC